MATSKLPRTRWSPQPRPVFNVFVVNRHSRYSLDAKLKEHEKGGSVVSHKFFQVDSFSPLQIQICFPDQAARENVLETIRELLRVGGEG